MELIGSSARATCRGYDHRSNPTTITTTTTTTTSCSQSLVRTRRLARQSSMPSVPMAIHTFVILIALVATNSNRQNSNYVLCFELEHEQQRSNQIALEEEIPIGSPTQIANSNNNNHIIDYISEHHQSDATATTKGQSASAAERGDEIRASPLASGHQSQQQHKLTRQSSGLDEEQVVDPFAFTFENYLRDAAAAPSEIKKETTSGNLDSTTRSATSHSSSSGLIIEDEDNSLLGKTTVAARGSQVIDYVFPSTASQSQSEQQQQVVGANEVKLPFSWKQLPTSKCSKECGRGHRINHISCIDLKFSVRVDNEFCSRYGPDLLPKPSELSDETCNEVDCPAEWTSEDLSGDIGNRFKRVRCSMVNRTGKTVYLDDSRCNNVSSSSNDIDSGAPSDNRQQQQQHQSYQPQIADEYSVDLVDSSSGGNGGGANDILPPSSSHQAADHNSVIDANHHSHRASNQAFFEPGPWSECSGATCGQLGTRTRKLICRVYLSRSAKFAELPHTSCHEATKLDTHEPCYIDCPPQLSIQDEIEINSRNYNSSDNNNNNYDNDSQLDETIYDLEMTRYVWRQSGWTKCNADCLGGQRESIVECWDKVAEVAVHESTLCNHEDKPAMRTETCNDIPCPPEWRLEPFSECTRKCGSAGIRTRSVTCVQQVPIRDGTSGLMVVSNDVCLENNGTVIPHKIEPCNRIDCPPEWSVGPWSECSKKCGGIRNRTVICVQEFASRDGPLSSGSSSSFGLTSNWAFEGHGPTRLGSSHNGKHHYASSSHPPLASPDLLEAVAISAKSWHPGKVTQVPFHECYQQYKTIPHLDEECIGTSTCPEEQQQPSAARTNSTVAMSPVEQAGDNYHDYLHLNREHSRRKTIVLKVGGKARVPAGKNLKIRCRPLGVKNHSLIGSKRLDQIEWSFEGVRIFANNSRVVEKQETLDDNSILGKDIMYGNSNDQLMADDPKARAPSGAKLELATYHRQGKSKGGRNLMTRSWSSYDQIAFVPLRGGRFSLVRDNTLRIKRLRPDDSGTYTCRYGASSETLELRVVSRPSDNSFDDKQANLVYGVGGQ